MHIFQLLIVNDQHTERAVFLKARTEQVRKVFQNIVFSVLLCGVET